MSFVSKPLGKGETERSRFPATQANTAGCTRWASSGAKGVQARLDGRRAYARPTHQEHLLSALDKAPPSTQQEDADKIKQPLYIPR